MGTKTLSLWGLNDTNDFIVKKESPNMGTKTTTKATCLYAGTYQRVKKESPNMGTKTAFRPY